MTSGEMHAAVELELQQVGAFIYDHFEPYEIDHYLNKAQDDIVINRASFFEGNQIVISDLKSIVKEFVLLPVIDASTYPEGDQYEFLVPYPADYWIFLAGEAGVTRFANPVIGSKTYLKMVSARNDQLDKVRVIPGIHHPYLRYPAFSQMEDFLHVFIDEETTLVDVKLRYLRYPVRILFDEDNLDEENFDCELSDSVHNEVVERAVALMRVDIPSRQNPPAQPVNPA